MLDSNIKRWMNHSLSEYHQRNYSLSEYHQRNPSLSEYHQRNHSLSKDHERNHSLSEYHQSKRTIAASHHCGDTNIKRWMNQFVRAPSKQKNHCNQLILWRWQPTIIVEKPTSRHGWTTVCQSTTKARKPLQLTNIAKTELEY